MDATPDDPAAHILLSYRRWAVVGCSPDPARASYRVADRLAGWGYHVVPVNPTVDEVLGRRCYPSLADVPGDEAIEVVDIFRNSRQAGRHVDEAIEMGARAVWMQLGVIDEAAADRARRAGLDVVMDRCPLIEYPRVAAASG